MSVFDCQFDWIKKLIGQALVIHLWAMSTKFFPEKIEAVKSVLNMGSHTSNALDWVPRLNKRGKMRRPAECQHPISLLLDLLRDEQAASRCHQHGPLHDQLYPSNLKPE